MRTMQSRRCQWLSAMIVLVVFLLAFNKSRQFSIVNGFQPSQIRDDKTARPFFESRFASSQLHLQAHAASMVELTDGRIRAFWFSGSREGASDVEIHSAVFDPQAGQWSEETVVATRQTTARPLMRYISKLGNPVCGRAADGRLWLFYVTVSVGGWSGSSITAQVSEDEGNTWSKPRRLVTSPFFNISTLVKGTPFLYQDGSLGVPVYHEMINKFAEIMRLDQQGNIIDVQRLSSGKERALQPVLLMKSTFEATVLMRNAKSTKPQNSWVVRTKDGGKSWSQPQDAHLLNPNSALTGLVLADGRILTVTNNQAREGISKGRDELALMIGDANGKNWKVLYELENRVAARNRNLDKKAYQDLMNAAARRSDATLAKAADDVVQPYAASATDAMCGPEGCAFEFSYPYLIQAKNGDFHLLYTWNRSMMKHLRFNAAWLDAQLEKISHE